MTESMSAAQVGVDGEFEEAEGRSPSLSFSEALRNALAALPARPSARPDEISRVDIVSTWAEVGGFVPQMLVVRVRRTLQGSFLCRDWKAWRNTQPGVRPTLYVTGRCTFPSTGYKASLRYAEPQGTIPDDLILDLIVTPPVGKQEEERVVLTVRYEQPAPTRYRTVTIRGAGAGSATVPVQEVS